MPGSFLKPFQIKKSPFFSALLLILLAAILKDLFSLRFTLYGIEAVRVGFSIIPVFFASLWLGPFWGMFVGGGSDLLQFLLEPVGPYLPVITAVEMLRGFLPGYLKGITGSNASLRNLLLQIGVTQILCSVILMPFILYQSFGVPVLDNIRTRLLVQVFAIPLYLGILFLIMHQWKSREALYLSEAKYRGLFDAARDALLVFTLDGVIVEANPAAFYLYGYEPGDFIGLTGKDIVHPDYQHFFPQFIQDVKEKGFFAVESVDIRQDGSSFHVEVRGTGILFEGQEHLLAVVRDISKRKETEAQLVQYTQKLEDLNGQLNQEMDRARQIHEQTLPVHLPTIEGISFAAYYQPAKKLGGDFYDVIQLDNQLVIYLSDVSGHGLDASMLSVFVKQSIKGYLSFTSQESITPSGILQHLTSQFREENYPHEYYICIFLGVLNLETLVITYSGMGFQDTPYVQLGSGVQRRLVSKGLFISSLLEQEILNFSPHQIQLTPGSTLFFHTDGLTEQRGEKGYYRDRLPQVFYENAHRSPHQISQVVVEDFQTFNNGSLQGKDDITFLVMKVDSTQEKDLSAPKGVTSQTKIAGTGDRSKFHK